MSCAECVKECAVCANPHLTEIRTFAFVFRGRKGRRRRPKHCLTKRCFSPLDSFLVATDYLLKLLDCNEKKSTNSASIFQFMDKHPSAVCGLGKSNFTN